MTDLRRVNLVLFFTRGVSLRTWDSIGSLQREVALYHALRPHLNSITFVTYGDWRDLSYADQLKGIRIICNRFRLPEPWYIRLLPLLYPSLVEGDVVFKSNQVPGAFRALQTARRAGKKFIARCGYLPSHIAVWSDGPESARTKQMQRMEITVFQGADRIVVTTPAMQKTIVERYAIESKKVCVIPNYVETDRFKPFFSNRQPNLLCFVGRLHEQKNLMSLLNAVKGLDVELDIIGGGNLQKQLMAKANNDKMKVRFLGNIPSADLPAYLNRASLFILPSHIEDHPKSLLEAMACGLPVIGTDVPGIREVIRHRDTGYLCNTSPENIRAAIREVLSDPELCLRMGTNARNFIVENCALKKVKEMELILLQEMFMPDWEKATCR
jgi:glycosyltransferase involved in cell wall biosynthesis